MPEPLTLELFTRVGTSTIPEPAWSDVEHGLRSLDGETRNSMFLGDANSTAGLIVVGGPRRYLLWVQQWDETGKELVIDAAIDPNAPPGTIRFTLENGQIDEHRLAITVDLESALQAARRFFKARELARDLTWDHQDPAADGSDRRGR